MTQLSPRKETTETQNNINYPFYNSRIEILLRYICICLKIFPTKSEEGSHLCPQNRSAFFKEMRKICTEEQIKYNSIFLHSQPHPSCTLIRKSDHLNIKPVIKTGLKERIHW